MMKCIPPSGRIASANSCHPAWGSSAATRATSKIRRVFSISLFTLDLSAQAEDLSKKEQINF
jgi:hypothetical protein